MPTAPSSPVWSGAARLGRMLAALLVVLAVSTVVVAITAFVLGVMALPLSLLVGVVVGTLLIPFAENPYLLFSTMLNEPVLTVVFGGLALILVVSLGPVRSEIESFREELGVHGRPSDTDLVRTVTLLSKQADIAEPDVFVTRRRRPESYAIGGRSDGTIVVTSGLLATLSESELRGVLAHEVAHLANGDSRLMGLVLTPTLVIEHFSDRDPPSTRLLLHSIQTFGLPYIGAYLMWALLSVVAPIQRVGNQFGLAVLSREREFAADRAAARLTGEPSALASALETLDSERGRPDEDVRTWRQSASVLDIVPTDSAETSDNPFRTHPPTDERIRRLRELAAEMER